MLIFSILGFLAIAKQTTANGEPPKYIAMGNLQTVIHGETLFSTDIDENRPPSGDLWCQLRQNGTVVPAEWARFVRTHDKKEFLADVSDTDHRAYLHFSKASATSSGKYRCEIKAPDGTLIFGNMFAYSQPIIQNNDSWPLQKSEKEEKPSTAIGSPVYAAYETTAHISCPIIGYPTPLIVWFKDGFPLEVEGRVSFNHQSHILSIEGVGDADAGVYTCEGSNQFPLKTDGEEQEFVAKLEQELRVGDDYGWLLPLAVILITLLLLFIIIFTCQRCTKYKSDHYNVAERERNLHDQEPLQKNSV